MRILCNDQRKESPYYAMIVVLTTPLDANFVTNAKNPLLRVMIVVLLPHPTHTTHIFTHYSDEEHNTRHYAFLLGY
jgi:hypothetical protein